MLDYAPPNTYVQKNLFELETAELGHFARHTTDPGWLDSLRSCTPEIYDTDLLTTIPSSPTSFPNVVDEHFGRTNEHDAAQADTLPDTPPKFFEDIFATSPEKNYNLVQPLITETLAKTCSAYFSRRCSCVESAAGQSETTSYSPACGIRGFGSSGDGGCKVRKGAEEEKMQRSRHVGLE
jgi:hypothetical protein